MPESCAGKRRGSLLVIPIRFPLGIDCLRVGSGLQQRFDDRGVPGPCREHERGLVLRADGVRARAELDERADDLGGGLRAGSGIGLASGTPGKITITYLRGVSAYGYGQYAYGIGGRDGTVFIERSNITLARGGFAGEANTELNGGPGIGGLVVSISNSSVTNVTGGPRAAGIGGIANSYTYVEIFGTTLTGIQGGSYSAGIGGSIQSMTEQDIAGEIRYKVLIRERLGDHIITDIIGMTTVHIVGSSVGSAGGIKGAGVGSGCATIYTGQGLCAIEISSYAHINATGGQYAANIGTGYRQANLTGFLDTTVTYTTPSRSDYTDTGNPSFTPAQTIGYGALNPSAEGSGLQVYFYIGLVKITNPVTP